MNHRNRRARLAHQLLESRQLLAVDGFAPIDGVGNNVENPEWGTVGEQFLRLSPAAFEDGISAPARTDEWNARDISNLISAQEGSIENDRFITSMWFQWGQFLDHDIARVFDVAPFEELTPVESLDIDENFPFNRSPFDPETGITTPREYVNHVTAFIDASVVYGSEESHALALRTLEGGKLKSQTTDVGELLPENSDGLINEPAPVPQFFIAGDVRSNENIGLTSMQTLWVREHNRIAEELATTDYADQDLSDPAVDEEIYQRARQIVSGLIQNITYNEFLPSTLGFNAIPTYSGYDSNIDPQISDEFAAAAYRIGHTTLTDELLIPGGDAIPLAEAFFRPDLVSAMGIDGILEGLTLQTMQEVDALIVDGVRNFLNDGPGFDLAAINIQRGRDQGLPDYNTLRESVGLDRLSSFDEMTSNEALADLFEMVYGTPDNADPWIALISEDHVPGTMTGETSYAILVDQFTRLRDGDRFYFENAIADADLVAEIKATRLSDVIERNTTAEVQDEVFWTRDTLVFRNGLDNEWLIRDFGDNGGAEVVFFGEPGIRDPDNREETAPVQRDEPINAVIVAGINPLGDGFFIPNALVATPLADEGIDEFIITADIEFFEGYGLGGDDIWVFESEIASIFASGDDGRDVLRSEADVPGGEVALTGGEGPDVITITGDSAESIVATGDGGA
ncbi:MAG: peroxidase family protein, partial [Rubripirellula sp.]